MCRAVPVARADEGRTTELMAPLVALLLLLLVIATISFHEALAHVVDAYPNNFTHAPTWEKLECFECPERWQCNRRPHECVWRMGRCLRRRGSQAPTSAPVKACRNINFKVPCEIDPLRCRWTGDKCVAMPATSSPTRAPWSGSPDCFHTYGKTACCGYYFYMGLTIKCTNPNGLHCAWSKTLPGCYDAAG